ncbi:hypothetical protein NPS70_17705 [Streptomyces sp. C10-9-1]|uniref:hypothetical protein n=1 Tax=Streptomyces sp. C10-9-1 TaxID=1859285 RepID=UPI0021112C8F|nr:hypothetical protein [Streptomyces sp. C10-9-1]MCQ6555011.1 hypothetical protein [Streptomyces sp. C10-9-1]
MSEVAKLDMDALDFVGALVLGGDLTDLHKQGVVGGLLLLAGLRAGGPPAAVRAREPPEFGSWWACGGADLRADLR